MLRGRSARMRVTGVLDVVERAIGIGSSRNVIDVFEMPSVIVELMWWAPATPETASSTFLVTWLSSSPGAAPNCEIVTVMSGTSTFGMRVIGSLLKLMKPSATMAADMTMGVTGCRIDHAEILSAMRASA